MTLPLFILGLALVAVASVFVTAPLFRARGPAPPGRAPDERERWERQKRQALAAIKEAELDHRMGKLSDDDLAAMRGRFEAQALEAMAVLEGRGGRT
jgi:hypothetical protein